MEYMPDLDRLKNYLAIAEAVVDEVKGPGSAHAKPALVAGLIQALAIEHIGLQIEHDPSQAVLDILSELHQIRVLIGEGGK